MKTYTIAYFTTLVVFVSIDFLWLSVMANRLYRPNLEDMLATEFRLAPAVVFYLIFAAGLTFLAVRTGLMSGSLATAIFYGGVVGFTAYATYDLTNQSTLKNWSTMLTIADLTWGSVLSAVSAGASFWITRRIVGL